MKFLKENIEKNLYAIGFGNGFLDETHCISTKRKNRQTRPHQNLKPLSIKRHYQQSENIPNRRKQILANHTSDRD